MVNKSPFVVDAFAKSLPVKAAGAASVPSSLPGVPPTQSAAAMDTAAAAAAAQSLIGTTLVPPPPPSRLPELAIASVSPTKLTAGGGDVVRVRGGPFPAGYAVSCNFFDAGVSAGPPRAASTSTASAIADRLFKLSATQTSLPC